MHFQDGSGTAKRGQSQGNVSLAEGPERAPGLYLDTNEVKAGTTPKQTPQQDPHKRRLDRLAGKAKEAREFAIWLRSVHPERAAKLDKCGAWLQFREYFEMEGSPRKLSGGIFCQQPLLCGMCASRRAARNVQQLRDKLVHVLTENRDHVPYFVTLTARSQPELRPMIEMLWGAWSKLWYRRKEVLKGRSSSIAGEFLGGFMHGEAKRGRKGWHFHLHGIIVGQDGLYKPKWERLVREWSELVGQDWASVTYQPLDGWEQARHVRDPKDMSLTKDIIETCKYSVKWEGKGYDDRWDAFLALSNFRNFRTFGAFRGLKLTDELTDDLSEFEAQEYHELVYRYLNGSYTTNGAKSLDAPKRCPVLDAWNDE